MTQMPSITDSTSRALLSAAPTRSLLNSSDSYKYEEIDGFLRLPSRRGRENSQSYREITLSKDQSNSDSEPSVFDGDADFSSEDGSDTPLTSQQSTLRNLEQNLTINSSSIETWLSLLSISLSTIPITSKNATKSRSEITLSILSRALSSHPSNKSSVKLRLKYLKAGEEVWHESKLRAEWEDALEVGGVEIWLEWLEWRVKKGGKGVDGVVEDARRVLGLLEHRGEPEIAKVRVFWRVAMVLQNAGFVERATAMFQAQAELCDYFCGKIKQNH
jgi:NRDE-2, necessary for RNA interference